MSVRVRFAPSPTGYLHVGGARTALFNYLFARHHGGTFVLRVEDTDAARSTDESIDAIVSSLRWLGLTWDEGPEVGGPHGPYFQSERHDLYTQRVTALLESGAAYRCYCTPEELEQRREAQVARGEAPRYDGRCRELTAERRATLEREGRTAAIRFRLDATGVSQWEDVVRGLVSFQNDLLDDFVLLRSDGWPAYNFACVVDDLDMLISHVIRGDDHISNTPRQLLLYRALDATPPRFAHVPMILGPDGKRLSKRHGATSIESYQGLGFLPEALDNFLALLGWSFDGQRELFTLRELEQSFTLERVGSNPSIFNVEKLEWMNGQHLKRLEDAERVRRVREFLSALGVRVPDRDDAWWTLLVRAVGERMKTLADVEEYGRFAWEPAVSMDLAAWSELLERSSVAERLEALAARIAADRAFSVESLEPLTRGLATELGIKAGELIGMARVALTGRKVSPGIFEVMVVLGREQTIARLRDAAARWEREAKRAGV